MLLVSTSTSSVVLFGFWSGFVVFGQLVLLLATVLLVLLKPCFLGQKARKTKTKNPKHKNPKLVLLSALLGYFSALNADLKPCCRQCTDDQC